MTRFRGKVAIVTGAGRGAGRAVCALLADEGAAVVASDSDAAAAAETARAIRRSDNTASFDSSDVSTWSGAESLVAGAVERHGGVDILINARMLDARQPLLTTSPMDFSRVVDHVLRGAFMPTRHASVQFRQQRSGRIVTLTSDAGRGEAGRVALAAASEGVIGMTRTVGRDLGRYRVTCNAIVTSGNEDEDASAAAMAATLCLEAASHVNGMVFGVDGGDVSMHANPAIVKSFHQWGGFTLEDMDDVFPALLA